MGQTQANTNQNGIDKISSTDPENPSTATTTPPPPLPTESTTLLLRLQQYISPPAPSSQTSQSSWIKMPIGEAVAAAEAVEQANYNPCPCLELTYSQRFMAFCACFALGSILSIVATMNVPSIVLAPKRFAIPFTLGNLVSLLSMSFLVGFKKQMQTMCHPDRAATSTVFVISMTGTIFAAFYLRSAGLCLIFVVLQYGAYIWYVASFIPYGRAMLLGCIKRCWKCAT